MIRLSSKKGEYGIRAVLALALHDRAVPVSVKSIVRKEQLSIRFMEQVMNALKVNGLVEAVRGPHGGYRLTRTPTEISLHQVLQATDGKGAKPLNTGPFRPSLHSRILSDLVSEIENRLVNHLNDLHFDLLVRRVKELEGKEAMMFHI